MKKMDRRFSFVLSRSSALVLTLTIVGLTRCGCLAASLNSARGSTPRAAPPGASLALSPVGAPASSPSISFSSSDIGKPLPLSPPTTTESSITTAAGSSPSAASSHLTRVLAAAAALGTSGGYLARGRTGSGDSGRGSYRKHQASGDTNTSATRLLTLPASTSTTLSSTSKNALRLPISAARKTTGKVTMRQQGPRDSDSLWPRSMKKVEGTFQGSSSRSQITKAPTPSTSDSTDTSCPADLLYGAPMRFLILLEIGPTQHKVALAAVSEKRVEQVFYTREVPMDWGSVLYQEFNINGGAGGDGKNNKGVSSSSQTSTSSGGSSTSTTASAPTRSPSSFSAMSVEEIEEMIADYERRNEDEELSKGLQGLLRSFDRLELDIKNELVDHEGQQPGGTKPTKHMEQLAEVGRNPDGDAQKLGAANAKRLIEAFEASVEIVQELVEGAKDALEIYCGGSVKQVSIRARGTGRFWSFGGTSKSGVENLDAMRRTRSSVMRDAYWTFLYSETGIDDFEVVTPEQELSLKYRAAAVRRQLWFGQEGTKMNGAGGNAVEVYEDGSSGMLANGDNYLNRSPSAASQLSAPLFDITDDSIQLASMCGPKKRGLHRAGPLPDRLHIAMGGTGDVAALYRRLLKETINPASLGFVDMFIHYLQGWLLPNAPQAEKNDDFFISCQVEDVDQEDESPSTTSRPPTTRTSPSRTTASSTTHQFQSQEESCKVDDLEDHHSGQKSPKTSLPLGTSKSSKPHVNKFPPLVLAIGPRGGSVFELASALMGPRFTPKLVYALLSTQVAEKRTEFLRDIAFRSSKKLLSDAQIEEAVPQLCLLYAVMLSWGIDEIFWEPLPSFNIGLADELREELFLPDEEKNSITSLGLPRLPDFVGQDDKIFDELAAGYHSDGSSVGGSSE
ncbi:unnamed protein product [Amoebophrya sp. A25]|nr:unnamed protein product [Amoebophrya sp. A25]|eukprot:GSA25T00003800001.1